MHPKFNHWRITTISCAFDLTANTIPCVSQKCFKGPYNVTFSRLESCLRSFASGSLTAEVTIVINLHGIWLVQNMNGSALNEIPLSLISLNRIWQLSFCGFAHLSRDFLGAVFPEPERLMSKISFAVIQLSKL